MSRPSGHRGGFTVIEMITIVGLIGLMLAIASPRLSRASRATRVASAATALTSRLVMARQAAINRGSSSVLHHSSGKVWVNIDVDGTQTLLRDTLFLATEYSVAVAASIDTVRYNSRGFAKLGASQTFQLTNDEAVRTVCVTTSGMVLRHGCTL